MDVERDRNERQEAFEPRLDRRSDFCIEAVGVVAAKAVVLFACSVLPAVASGETGLARSSGGGGTGSHSAVERGVVRCGEDPLGESLMAAASCLPLSLDRLALTPSPPNCARIVGNDSRGALPQRRTAREIRL